MIRLGHIEYSNCFPVHARLLEQEVSGIEIVRDIPSRLNTALAAGRIDVAPCSSIEYARHASEYVILPGFVIGSAGPVQSILLESAVPFHELHGARVAVPTASATSVVLLRILLELHHGIRPDYVWFEQGPDVDPLGDDIAAALRIGDIALTRRPPADRTVHDLGAKWYAWTGLPFAFAVWQARRDSDRSGITRLLLALRDSRSWFCAHEAELASRHAARFGLPPDRLLAYWRSLRFDLDAAMQQGLLHFYRLAAKLGEAPHIDTLEYVDPP